MEKLAKVRAEDGVRQPLAVGGSVGKLPTPRQELFLLRSKKYRPTVLAGGDLTLLLSCFYLPYPSTSSSSSSSSFSADRRRAAVLEEGKRSACQFGAAFPSVSAAEAAGR